MIVLCIAKYMEQAIAWVSFDCETRGVGYGLLVGGASTQAVLRLDATLSHHKLDLFVSLTAVGSISYSGRRV